MNFYRYPEAYFVLRQPSTGMLDVVRRLLAAHLDRPLTSLMDPCCGPGNWLEPFAREGVRVAGNDIDAGMIDQARRAIAGDRAEWTLGDMCALAFATGPYDAAIELAGTFAQLDNSETIVTFLREVGRFVRTGGLFLAAVQLDDGVADPHPSNFDHTIGPLPIPSGGRATARYQVMKRDHDAQCEHITRTVALELPDASPVELQDAYTLRVHRAAELEALIAASGCWELRGAHSLWDDEPIADLAGQYGEYTLILRRIAEAPSNGYHGNGNNGHHANGLGRNGR